MDYVNVDIPKKLFFRYCWGCKYFNNEGSSCCGKCVEEFIS